jgi:ferric-dicitrate binding protein FerR (iron transport regulator)
MAPASRDSTSQPDELHGNQLDHGRQLDQLFVAVREAQDQTLRLGDPHELARARARLLQAVDRAQPEARPLATAPARSPAWRWGLGTMVAAACAFAVMFTMSSDPALEFVVDGVELASSSARIISDDEPRNLSFSDSTNVELAPGSSMFVEDLRSNGANVVLERGEVSLSVHHEHDTSWQVSAGPYAVHVTGTEFSVEWEPGSEYLAVEVEEGSVRIEGPEGAIATLRAGDSLVRERGKATIEPEPLATVEPKPSVPESIASRTPPSIDEVVPDADAPADAPALADKAGKPVVTEVEAPDWMSHFDDANYPAAWQRLAEQSGGTHGEAKRADADALLDLADVARFTKHHQDAIVLLEQLRDRFPNSDEAGEAAFTLGRIAADRGSLAKAAAYFEQYLDERPNGSLVDDALGRLMDSYEALGRGGDAKATAERYLARFPKGPHAGKAQKLLGE